MIEPNDPNNPKKKVKIVLSLTAMGEQLKKDIEKSVYPYGLGKEWNF